MRNIILLALLMISFAVHAADEPHPEFYACEKDSDCIVVSGICGGWEVVNKGKAKEAEQYFGHRNSEIDCAFASDEKPTSIGCNKGKCAIDFSQTVEDSCYKHTGTNQSWGWCQCVAISINNSGDIMPQTKSILAKNFPDGSPTNIGSIKFPNSIAYGQIDKLRNMFSKCVLQTTNYIEKK